MAKQINKPGDPRDGATVLAADNPEVEAVFLSCTGVRSVAIAQELENTLGKPAVTSNQAAFWQCLRLAGCSAKVPGFGRLLQL